MLQNQGLITILRGPPRLLSDCKLYRNQEINILTNRTSNRTSLHCNQQMSSWKKFVKNFVKLRWGGTRVQRYSYHHWCSQPLGHASYKQWTGRESRNILEMVGLNSNEIPLLENTFYFPFQKGNIPVKLYIKYLSMTKGRFRLRNFGFTEQPKYPKWALNLCHTWYVTW